MYFDRIKNLNVAPNMLVALGQNFLLEDPKSQNLKVFATIFTCPGKLPCPCSPIYLDHEDIVQWVVSSKFYNPLS